MTKAKKKARLKGQPHDFQLILEMDDESFLRLRSLSAAVEAASMGELIRRSLQAYELFEPKEKVGHQEEVLANFRSRTHVSRCIHVRIPRRTKERLDRVRDETGSTYSEVVRQSLRVFAQLVRDRDALLRDQECSGRDWVKDPLNPSAHARRLAVAIC